ncbi:MAG TPA: class I SAM-dependent methyltransferase [Chitinophagaceae bacterium]
MPSGKWIEIDEPAIIEYKNSVLPSASCPNALERIAINFEREKLINKLSPYKNDAHVIVIIEGVLMYLGAAQKNELLETLTTLFPIHVLFCDLMKKNFFEKFGKPIHEKLAKHGAHFTDVSNEPWNIFLQHGYRQTAAVSTMKTAVKIGVIKMPLLFFYLMMRKHIMGYAVYRFEFSK